MALRATLLALAVAGSCRREAPPTPAPPPVPIPRASAAEPSPGATAPAPSAPDAGQSCLDAQLAARGLNPYGDPPDTMYAGGTPLFDETTGKRRDRAEYVFAKHPEIARACGGAD